MPISHPRTAAGRHRGGSLAPHLRSSSYRHDHAHDHAHDAHLMTSMTQVWIFFWIISASQQYGTILGCPTGLEIGQSIPPGGGALLSLLTISLGVQIPFSDDPRLYITSGWLYIPLTPPSISHHSLHLHFGWFNPHHTRST